MKKYLAGGLSVVLITAVFVILRNKYFSYSTIVTLKPETATAPNLKPAVTAADQDKLRPYGDDSTEPSEQDSPQRPDQIAKDMAARMDKMNMAEVKKHLNRSLQAKTEDMLNRNIVLKEALSSRPAAEEALKEVQICIEQQNEHVAYEPQQQMQQPMSPAVFEAARLQIEASCVSLAMKISEKFPDFRAEVEGKILSMAKPQALKLARRQAQRQSQD